MSTAAMWSKSKPDVEFQYGGRLGEFNDMSSHSQNYMPHCRVLPPGEFNVIIPEPHAILHGERIPSAILKIVFAVFFYFIFVLLMLLGFGELRLPYRLRYTCYVRLRLTSLTTAGLSMHDRLQSVVHAL